MTDVHPYKCDVKTKRIVLYQQPDPMDPMADPKTGMQKGIYKFGTTALFLCLTAPDAADFPTQFSSKPEFLMLRLEKAKTAPGRTASATRPPRSSEHAPRATHLHRPAESTFPVGSAVSILVERRRITESSPHILLDLSILDRFNAGRSGRKLLILGLKRDELLPDCSLAFTRPGRASPGEPGPGYSVRP